jgi:hypothetical protein
LKQDILLLYKFIDWLVNLPEDFNLSFHNEIVKYEEEKKMPYINTAEKIGIEKGIAQGLLEGIEFALELKFGFDGLKLMTEIRKINNIDNLKLVKEVIRVDKNIDDVSKICDKVAKD